MSKGIFTAKQFDDLIGHRDIVSIRGRFFVAIEVLKSAELKSADEVAALPEPTPDAPAEPAVDAPAEAPVEALTVSSRKK